MTIKMTGHYCGYLYLNIMEKISATKFKEQCLHILSNLENEGIVITKHGRPVARLIPIEAESGRLIGSLKGELTVNGDILSTGLKWDAES